MKTDKLNQLRRMAGVPQDFRAKKKSAPIVEDVVPGMSQVLRGGKYKFYLVTDANKNSELGDVITEVDFPALTNILKGAEGGTKDWELFPHNEQNKALDLARSRMAKAGVDEQVGDGAFARNAHNVPLPSDEEMEKLEYEEYEEDFEPTTNICPDCEGGEHPPTFGKCERCDGEGEIFESKKAAKDFDGDGKVESSEDEHKGVVDKKIKASKEEQEEVKKCPCGCDPAKCKCAADCKCGCNAKEEQEEKADKDYDGDGKVESSEDEHKGGVDKKIKASKEEQEEVKKCKCGNMPDDCKCGPDCKCGCNAVKESAHYHTSANYPLTHKDGDQPHNVDAQYDTVWTKDESQSQRANDDYLLTNDTTPVKVPAKVLSELKRVIDDTKRLSEKNKPRDFETANYYEDTAAALQIVYDYLNEKTVQGLKRAQQYSQRMMNIQRVLMPDVVWKFIVNGGTARSLKAYVNDVKEPVTGKPFGTVPITTLNKNTHTE